MRRGLLIGLIGIACGGTATDDRVRGDVSDASGGTKGRGGGAGAAAVGGGSGTGGTNGSGGTRPGSGGFTSEKDGGTPDSSVVADAATDATADVSEGDGANGDAGDGDREDAPACTPPDAAADIIAAACAKVGALPCRQGYDLPTCIAQTHVALARNPSCECQTLVVLACGAEHGWLCPDVFGGFHDDTHLAPACADVEDDYQRCMNQGDGCATGFEVGGGCRTVCDQYTADCARADAGFECTCSYGPKLGVRFSVAACSGVEEIITRHCR